MAGLGTKPLRPGIRRGVSLALEDHHLAVGQVVVVIDGRIQRRCCVEHLGFDFLQPLSPSGGFRCRDAVATLCRPPVFTPAVLVGALAGFCHLGSFPGLERLVLADLNTSLGHIRRPWHRPTALPRAAVHSCALLCTAARRRLQLGPVLHAVRNRALRIQDRAFRASGALARQIRPRSSRQYLAAHRQGAACRGLVPIPAGGLLGVTCITCVPPKSAACRLASGAGGPKPP